LSWPVCASPGRRPVRKSYRVGRGTPKSLAAFLSEMPFSMASSACRIAVSRGESLQFIVCGRDSEDRYVWCRCSRWPRTLYASFYILEVNNQFGTMIEYGSNWPILTECSLLELSKSFKITILIG